MKTKEEILEEVDNSVISSVESADYYNGVTYGAEYVIDNYLEPLQKENEALKASVYALLNGSEQCKLQAQNKRLMELLRTAEETMYGKAQEYRDERLLGEANEIKGIIHQQKEQSDETSI